MELLLKQDAKGELRCQDTPSSLPVHKARSVGVVEKFGHLIRAVVDSPVGDLDLPVA
ncbi:MAG: hypothetical protein R3C01_06350 [Planctomycetaceae bacterium]